MIIEPAAPLDLPAISAVFLANRAEHGLFREREAELRRNLGNFLVARDADGKVVGCAGLHRDPQGWAELFGVAVLPALRGQGIGSKLVTSCVREAAGRGVVHLWLATMKPDYFARFLFRPMPRGELPTSTLLRKLWQLTCQPIERWAPVLFGHQHTYMRRELEFAQADPPHAVGAGERAGRRSPSSDDAGRERRETVESDGRTVGGVGAGRQEDHTLARH